MIRRLVLWLGCVAAGLALAAVSAQLGRGGVGQALTNLVLGVFGITGGSIAALVLVGRSRRAASLAFGLTLFAAAQFAAVPLGYRLALRDVVEARAWCESLVPRLQEYHTRNGRYPPSLEALGGIDATPELLAGTPFYRSSGEGYWFSVPDPRSMVGFWTWESRNGQWRRND